MAYAKTGQAAFQKQYDESQSRRTGNFEGWRPKIGPVGKLVRNVFRIMPAHPNMLVVVDDQGTKAPWPIVTTRVHFNLGPNQDTGCMCLELFDKECPACIWQKEVDARAGRASNPGEAAQFKAVAKKIRSQLRFRMQIVDMAQPQIGVQRYSFGVEVEKSINMCFQDDNVPPQFRDVADPEHGRNIIMEVTTKPGPDEWPDYQIIRAADTPTALMDMEWLDQIQDLAAEIIEPTEAEVRAALQGQRIQRSQTAIVGATVAPAPALPPTRQATAPAPQVVTGPVPEAARPVGASATAPAPAPAAAAVPTPAPSTAPPATEPSRRRGSRGSAPSTPVTAAPAPAAVAPPSAPAPAAGPATVPPPTTTRQPMRPAGAEPTAVPYAQARKLMDGYMEAGNIEGRPVPRFTPMEITPDQVRVIEAAKGTAGGPPPCYTTETDPSDSGCRDCQMLLPCFTARYGLPA